VELIHAPQIDILVLGVFELLAGIRWDELHRPFQQVLVLCQTEGTKLQRCRINLQLSVIKPKIMGFPVFGVICGSFWIVPMVVLLQGVRTGNKNTVALSTHQAMRIPCESRLWIVSLLAK
jgi:hypothetical protein